MGVLSKDISRILSSNVTNVTNVTKVAKVASNDLDELNSFIHPIYGDRNFEATCDMLYDQYGSTSILQDKRNEFFRQKRALAVFIGINAKLYRRDKKTSYYEQITNRSLC